MPPMPSKLYHTNKINSSTCIKAFFNPRVQTLIKAALNGQLEDSLFMKTDLIRKYVPPSLATPKGRMKRPRAVIRSTHKKVRNRGTNEGAPEDENSAMRHHMPNNTIANSIRSDEKHEANNICLLCCIS